MRSDRDRGGDETCEHVRSSIRRGDRLGDAFRARTASMERITDELHTPITATEARESKPGNISFADTEHTCPVDSNECLIRGAEECTNKCVALPKTRERASESLRGCGVTQSECSTYAVR